jgi:hypothetical protein
MCICFFGKSFAQTRITIDYKNTPGTSWLPYCYLQNVTAELWGGGGGGGGAYAPRLTNRNAGGGGGGGGAYISNANFGNPTANINVQVGYGGTAGSGASGGAGNNPTNHSQITIGSFFAIAKGGKGGGGADANSGNYINGSAGGGGTYESNIGASGQNGNPGGAGTTNTNPVSWAARGGTGGSSPSGGGSGGGYGQASSGTTSQNGSNGNPVGGGGGGGAAYCAANTIFNSAASANGGAGAAGNVKISFDFAIPNLTLNKTSSNFCMGGSDTISIDSTVCSGSTYQWYKDGIAISGATSSSLTVTEAGTYYVIVTLHISDLKTVLVSQGLPSSASVSPNSVKDSVQSDDCVVTTKQSTSSTISAAICTGESYILNGQTYTTSGSFTQYLTNAQGCDSIITLNTTVHPAPEVEFLTMETCAEDGQIVLSFTGQPPFTMNYTFNADCVGTDLNPNLYGLPTVFGDGYPNILSWTNTGSNYLVGILPYFFGQLRFHILEIIDNIGCRSVRPE